MDCVRIQLIKENDLKAKPIKGIADAARFIQDLISDFDRELFVSVNVDNKNKPLNYSIISMGSLDSALVHPREVFKAAILSSACSVLFFHNHPSGNIEPSVQDITITERLVEAGNLLEIRVLDHIIVTEDNYFSFAKEGLIVNENNGEYTSKLNAFDLKKLNELIVLSKKVQVPITIQYSKMKIGLYFDGYTANQWVSLEDAMKQLTNIRLSQKECQVLG